MKAEWLAWGLLALVLLYLLWCWFVDRRDGVVQRDGFDDGVDFSIYLYSPKRGPSARWDD
ncbi:hypothetical protein NT239_06570 [Chitinibacter sp. SCUT-21]|uniref:hypothetical protein n=1 Tax=Chitinibacter sp. SCUT-21 TaxID=2970891 RepID=UPI0035A6DCE2